MTPEESATTLTRFTAIFQSLLRESDRGCVLVVGSMVEQALEKQITARLLPKARADDELLGRSKNNPIATFSAKIDLAYRLGIITSNERTIFHQLRDLRNNCAHHIDQQDFSAHHFKDRMRNIIEKSLDIWNVMQTHIAPGLFPEDPPTTIEMFIERVGWRRAFEVFFAIVVAHKEATLNRVPQVNALHIGQPN